jgi:uncharacterized membrane protein YjjP (DUF1212 family)
MGSVVPTLLAAVAVGLFGVALAAMSVGELLVAGLCFLSASVVIYLRETRLAEERAG